MKKLLYTLLTFVTLVNTANGQAIDIKIGMWGVQNIYLHDGKIKYESNSGETPFNTVMQFQRYDGSTQVKAQAIYVLAANGSETAISDSIFVTTSDFTQATGTYWSKEFAKTAKLQPNNKAGVVKLKWRYWDTYSGTTPKWSSYYYASKTYQTILTAKPADPPYPRVNIYSYWNSESVDHLYTPEYTSSLGGGHWKYEGKAFVALAVSIDGAVPVYSYWNSEGVDHLYSTENASSMGGGKWIKEAVVFYAFKTPVSGTVPLYSYWNSEGVDHLYSTENASSMGGGKWIKEGVAFYVYP